MMQKLWNVQLAETQDLQKRNNNKLSDLYKINIQGTILKDFGAQTSLYKSFTGVHVSEGFNVLLTFFKNIRS